MTQRATRRASSSDHLSDSQLAFRCINMQATPKLRWMRGRARGVCSRSLFPQEPWHEALIPQRERRVTALFTTRATSSAPSSLAWRWLCCRLSSFLPRSPFLHLSFHERSVTPFSSPFSTLRNVWTGRPIVNVKINSPRPFQRSSSTRVLYGSRVPPRTQTHSPARQFIQNRGKRKSSVAEPTVSRTLSCRLSSPWPLCMWKVGPHSG